MAHTFNGTSQSIESVTPVTAVPLTISCWYYPTLNVGTVLVAIGTSGGVDRFQIGSNPASAPASAAVVQGGTVGSATVSGTASLSTWNHAAGVFSANNNRVAYWNGTAGTAETTSATPSGINRINLAARYIVTLGNFFTGGLAEVAIWNAALTAAEIAELAAGFNPRLIRPQSIVYFNRLINASQDIRGGLTLTNVGGATTVSTHPRIIYP
jgi:hypothetical protein